MGKGIFSEERGSIDDVLKNATDVEEQRIEGIHEAVDEAVHPGGVLMTSDCSYCGIQWKGVVKWPEIAGFFLGHKVPNTNASQKGVAMLFGCKKCSHVSPMTITWDDVDRYVGRGVKMGALPNDIYRAREQIMTERARMAQRR